jgi:hypothetical protein
VQPLHLRNVDTQLVRPSGLTAAFRAIGRIERARCIPTWPGPDWLTSCNSWLAVSLCRANPGHIAGSVRMDLRMMKQPERAVRDS